jgi:hypothetical protein
VDTDRKAEAKDKKSRYGIFVESGGIKSEIRQLETNKTYSIYLTEFTIIALIGFIMLKEWNLTAFQNS